MNQQENSALAPGTRVRNVVNGEHGTVAPDSAGHHVHPYSRARAGVPCEFDLVRVRYDNSGSVWSVRRYVEPAEDSQRVPACPSWCDRDHREPRPGQAWELHERFTLSSGGGDASVTVSASWAQRLDQHPAGAEKPRVTVAHHTLRDTTVAELAPDTAELLAEVMRASGSGGALADGLAEAARLIEESSDGQPGPGRNRQ